MACPSSANSMSGVMPRAESFSIAGSSAAPTTNPGCRVQTENPASRRIAS